jgi:hypothetical protein
MESYSKPTKQQVRDWLRLRRLSATPLSDLDVLRREVGWQSASPAAPAAIKHGMLLRSSKPAN